MVCTAGLATEHDMTSDHGIDLDDLDPQHSLTTDPTLVRLRQGAEMLGEDIWVAVKLPGEYDGDDDLDDEVAIRRWTTVGSTPTSWAGYARPWPSTPTTRMTRSVTRTKTWNRSSESRGSSPSWHGSPPSHPPAWRAGRRLVARYSLGNSTDDCRLS